MELSNHKIRHRVSHGKEHRHTDHKIDQIARKPRLHRHGNSGQKLQISKGMQPQVNQSRHGKRASLKHRVDHIQRQRTEHKHKLQRLRNAGQKHRQHSGNKHGTVLLALVGVHSPVHRQSDSQ